MFNWNILITPGDSMDDNKAAPVEVYKVRVCIYICLRQLEVRHAFLLFFFSKQLLRD